MYWQTLTTEKIQQISNVKELEIIVTSWKHHIPFRESEKISAE